MLQAWPVGCAGLEGLAAFDQYSDKHYPSYLLLAKPCQSQRCKNRVTNFRQCSGCGQHDESSTLLPDAGNEMQRRQLLRYSRIRPNRTNCLRSIGKNGWGDRGRNLRPDDGLNCRSTRGVLADDGSLRQDCFWLQALRLFGGRPPILAVLE